MGLHIIIGSLTAHHAHWHTGQQRSSTDVCSEPALDETLAVAQAPHLCFNSASPCSLGLPGLGKILQLSLKYSKMNSAKLKKNLLTLFGFMEARKFRDLSEYSELCSKCLGVKLPSLLFVN